MPYGNYNFTIDSSFRPFTMQEMLVPFTAYKDAYEKTEEAYTDLTKEADKFKYLSENLPEGSKARSIYEGYANDLKAQADDLATNGLTMGNRRALTSLRRRYQSEIGLLDKYETELQELLKPRYAAQAQGKQMIYANENPTIDDLLNGTINRYGISQDDLHKLGMQAGQSTSSRIYGNTKISDLTSQYQQLLQTQGYSPELVNEFRHKLGAIPELNSAVNDILRETGADANLNEAQKQVAKQAIVNGIIDGVVYKESRDIKQNPDYMTEYQRETLDRYKAEQDYKFKKEGFIYDPKTRTVSEDPNYVDKVLERQMKLLEKKQELGIGTGKSGSGSSGKGSSTEHLTQSSNRVKFTWDNGDPGNKEYKGKVHQKDVEKDETDHVGPLTDYDMLPDYAQKIVNRIVQDGTTNLYDIYFKPYEKYWWGGSSEPELEIVPRKVVTTDRDKYSASSSESDTFAGSDIDFSI